MKICIVKPKSVNVDPWIPEFRKRGHKVYENNHNNGDIDVIIGASNSVMTTTRKFHKIFPNVPMINYNWDVYEWVWRHPRGHDWKAYGELLKESNEIWCPSESVVKRNEERFVAGTPAVDKCSVRDLKDVNGSPYLPWREYLKEYRGYPWQKNNI